MEIKEIVRSTQKSVKPEIAKELLSKMRKAHEKLVKGKFEFLDAGTGWLEFNYRIFKEDMLVTYKFIHGEICTIPMGLAKHLNNTIKKVRKPNPRSGESGGELIGGKFPDMIIEQNSRIRFTPLEVL